MEQTAIIKIKSFGHVLGVFEDLKAGRKLHSWEIAHFLQQWHVAVGFNIARYAGIAVPVPGAADIASLFAKPDIGETRLPKLVPKYEPTKTTADDQNLTFIVQRFPLDWLV